MLILCLNSRTPAFDKKETKKLKLKQKQQKLTGTCDTSLIVVMNSKRVLLLKEMTPFNALNIYYRS